MSSQAVVQRPLRTASQPDTSGDAYTFLEFNTQGDDYGYRTSRAFQPTRSPTWRAAAVGWPANPPLTDRQSTDPGGSGSSSSSAGPAVAGSFSGGKIEGHTHWLPWMHSPVELAWA
ncbi:hypothetical protein HPP92_014918 [Vanilla planifolia]|uniref:Uncharacterized protein n=1 Tax=Vanilla planifolia TaxID=51239 RepID=A0A835QGW8_VANPL|nr:hypothetical protein HPP92_014918 [Vanilla planifolia]